MLLRPPSLFDVVMRKTRQGFAASTLAIGGIVAIVALSTAIRPGFRAAQQHACTEGFVCIVQDDPEFVQTGEGWSARSAACPQGTVPRRPSQEEISCDPSQGTDVPPALRTGLCWECVPVGQ